MQGSFSQGQPVPALEVISGAIRLYAGRAPLFLFLGLLCVSTLLLRETLLLMDIRISWAFWVPLLLVTHVPGVILMIALFSREESLSLSGAFLAVRS
ncbi:MAG: hypothetical protein GX606_07265, partial [Elusimicrobia bacterium]|nr:hypothetical protein [Elusimicrobiota bacterium]